jgi:hypothetical protein
MGDIMKNTARIENNRLTGTYDVMAQFLHGSPDCTKYLVRVLLDGADINEIIRRAVDAALIVLRKRIKTKAQADALAQGITFMNMVAAIAKDPTAQVASIDVNQIDVNALPDSVRQAWIEKLMTRETSDNTDHVVESE